MSAWSILDDLLAIMRDRKISAGIRGAQDLAQEGVRSAERALDEVQLIDERIERIVLTCASMWELTKEKTGLTDADLARKMEEIEVMRRAEIEAAKALPTDRCSGCGGRRWPNRATCAYCGAPSA